MSLVRFDFSSSGATDIAELFRALAATCVQEQVTRVLVIPGEIGFAGERALRNALTVMVLGGIPDDFRLAIVVGSARAAFAYRNLQRDLSAAEVAARLFDNEADATRWLDLESESAPARACALR